MLEELSSQGEPVCSGPRYVMKGCTVGTGVMFAAALLWVAKHPVAKSVLGVFAGGLTLLGTGYVLKRKILTQASIPEKPAPENDTQFQPIGKTIEHYSVLKKFFERGYGRAYMPKLHQAKYCLYIGSELFYAHCKKTKVYYSQRFGVTAEEAYKMVAQRHLVNIGGKALGNSEEAKKLLGPQATYSYIYEGAGAKREKPGLVGIFTRTPVFTDFCYKICACGGRAFWYTPQGLRVDLFSIPGPALDSPSQPYFDYFVSSEGKLDKDRYREYMEELFLMALCAFFDESEATEFVLPEVGLGTFVEALASAEKQAAVDQFYLSLGAVLKSYRTDMWAKRAQDRGVEKVQFTSIFISKEKAECRKNQLDHIKEILEDSPAIKCVKAQVVVRSIQEHLSPHESMSYEGLSAVKNPDCPFVVNPCDPAARIGNHNDPSKSFDGAIGAYTPASLVASPTHNTRMVEKDRYIAI